VKVNPMIKDLYPAIMARYPKLTEEKRGKVLDVLRDVHKSNQGSGGLPMVGAIALGAIVGAVSAVPFGLIAGGGLMALVIGSGLNYGHGLEFAKNHGAIAHLLDDRLLRRYQDIIGHKALLGEIQQAYADGIDVTGDGRNFARQSGSPLAKTRTFDIPKDEAPGNDAPTGQPQDDGKKPATAGDTAIENRGNGADIILGDLVNLMVHEPKPTIISAVPRTGKGYLVNQVIERFKAKGFTVWVLQPKPAPAEFAYWKCADRFLGIDLENYQRDSEGITEVMQDFFFKWRQQNTSETPSILVIDELVKIQALMPKFYRDFLIPQCIVEGSSGETAGRYLYLLTQSPLVSDLGMSGGNRSTFEFIGLEKATSQNHAESIKKSVSGLGELPSVESYAKSPVGTLAYYSRLNGWVPMPTYAKPTIGPGDAMCPELDALVNQRVLVGAVVGSGPIGETMTSAEVVSGSTVSKAPTKVEPDEEDLENLVYTKLVDKIIALNGEKTTLSKLRRSLSTKQQKAYTQLTEDLIFEDERFDFLVKDMPDGKKSFTVWLKTDPGNNDSAD
jgi:hypothetical protein